MNNHLILINTSVLSSRGVAPHFTNTSAPLCGHNQQGCQMFLGTIPIPERGKINQITLKICITNGLKIYKIAVK
jgi:hypothetical protein